MVVAYSHIKRLVTPALLGRRELRLLKQDAKRQGKAERPDESYPSTTPLVTLWEDANSPLWRKEWREDVTMEGRKEERKKDRQTDRNEGNKKGMNERRMATRNEKRKKNKDEAYRRPWSLIKCNKQSRQRNSALHAPYTADNKNQKCYLQNLERKRSPGRL